MEKAILNIVCDVLGGTQCHVADRNGEAVARGTDCQQITLRRAANALWNLDDDMAGSIKIAAAKASGSRRPIRLNSPASRTAPSVMAKSSSAPNAAPLAKTPYFSTQKRKMTFFSDGNWSLHRSA